jgi:hypothetical protein
MKRLFFVLALAAAPALAGCRSSYDEYRTGERTYDEDLVTGEPADSSPSGRRARPRPGSVTVVRSYEEHGGGYGDLSGKERSWSREEHDAYGSSYSGGGSIK